MKIIGRKIRVRSLIRNWLAPAQYVPKGQRLGRRTTVHALVMLQAFGVGAMSLVASSGAAQTEAKTGPKTVSTKTAPTKTAPTQGVGTILVMGDSLSAEYGLVRGAGWVALMGQRLKERKINHEIINASISGETTAGGQTRFEALLQKHRPQHVILELGANDALRGLPLNQTEANLRNMIRSAKAIKANVVLVGIQIPPNYGKTYTETFAGLFPALAKSEGIGLVPFMLEGIADKAEYFQADRIHPNEKAQPIILNNIWPAVAKALKIAA